jgi:hypothetical protein
MSADERWLAAIAAELEQPSDWRPDRAAFEAALARLLAARGCEWAGLALCILRARVHAKVARPEFAARLGLTEDELAAMEGTWSR